MVHGSVHSLGSRQGGLVRIVSRIGPQGDLRRLLIMYMTNFLKFG